KSRLPPPWVSQARDPIRQAPPSWPDTSGNSGRSNPCTGSVTPSTKRTNPRSEPDPGPESWPRSVTSPSEPSDWPDAPISPKPPDGPHAAWTGPSPSSDSHHDLGTAVLAQPGGQCAALVGYGDRGAEGALDVMPQVIPPVRWAHHVVPWVASASRTLSCPSANSATIARRLGNMARFPASSTTSASNRAKS